MVVDGGFVRRSSIAFAFSCVGLMVRPPGSAFPTLGARPDLVGPDPIGALALRTNHVGPAPRG